jgi:hypothetical protein
VFISWPASRATFFRNFVWPSHTPSQEEHKTIISGLKINVMALFDQIDFSAFLRLRKMTYRNFINSGILQSAAAFASIDCFMPIYFPKLPDCVKSM